MADPSAPGGILINGTLAYNLGKSGFMGAGFAMNSGEGVAELQWGGDVSCVQVGGCTDAGWRMGSRLSLSLSLCLTLSLFFRSTLQSSARASRTLCSAPSPTSREGQQRDWERLFLISIPTRKLIIR